MLKNKQQFVKILSVSLVLLNVLLVVSLSVNIIKGITLSSKKQRLENDLALLEQATQKNEQEIQFKQSQDYIDRFSREHLGLNNKNEEIYKGVEK